jgi:hypothetical protein
MNKSTVSIIALLLSTSVLAKPTPTGGKACEIFNSFYKDDLGGIFAKSRDFNSTDAELASILARGGFEANQIKYRITVRNNCRAHVEAMEKQYDSKSANQEHNKQKDSESSEPNRVSDADGIEITGEGWKSVSNWRKLKTDMEYDEVRMILGEPHRIDGGGVARWYYQNGGKATFIGDKLQSWEEPRK